MDLVWAAPVQSSRHVVFPKLLKKFWTFFPGLKFTETATNNARYSLEVSIRNYTIALSNSKTYDPSIWHARGKGLMRIGYPELAVGDAFKALSLLESMEKDDPLSIRMRPSVQTNLQKNARVTALGINPQSRDGLERLDDYARRLKLQIVLTLAQALYLCNCFSDCMEIAESYLNYPGSFGTNFLFIRDLAKRAQAQEDILMPTDEPMSRDDLLDDREQRRSGTIINRIYPWMAMRYTCRNDRATAIAGENVMKASQNKCFLRQSSIRYGLSNVSAVERMTDVWGIFAARDIREGEIFFHDRETISGIDHEDGRCSNCRCLLLDGTSYQSLCCSEIYCDIHCHSDAHTYHHQRACDAVSIEDLLDASGIDHSRAKEAELSLLYRILAAVEQYPEQHPLKTPVLGPMTAAYSGGPELFNFETHVKLPLRMLQNLGIDVYADHGTDFWVLRTIQARLNNNTRDFEDGHGGYQCIANLSYQFFNHSCRPNVYPLASENCSAFLRMKANRNIRKGEELFITYLDPAQLDLPYIERQHLLAHWTGGSCQCSRCRREYGSLSRARVLDQRSARGRIPVAHIAAASETD